MKFELAEMLKDALDADDVYHVPKKSYYLTLNPK